MSRLQTKTQKPKIQTDTWQTATWGEYIEAINQPAYAKARGYYHDGRMRIEMVPLGNPHSRDHYTASQAIGLFAAFKDVRLDGHDNCTYRKTGCDEAQPDLSFYIGESAAAIPWDVTIIDLDHYPAPDLVIEVAYSSLADDKGEKRLLYEALGIREYWIIDVQTMQVTAFTMENGGSRKITQSLVLPGLDLKLLEEAFRRSRETDHSRVIAWLIQQFQA
ncbi:MAG: Uma2 family endonuclease [Cyanobacteria bacterium P01_G01_bin.38]